MQMTHAVTVPRCGLQSFHMLPVYSDLLQPAFLESLYFRPLGWKLPVYLARLVEPLALHTVLPVADYTECNKGLTSPLV